MQAGLPWELAEVLRLRIWEQLSFADVAETLQLSETTVRRATREESARLARQRRRARMAMAGCVCLLFLAVAHNVLTPVRFQLLPPDDEEEGGYDALYEEGAEARCSPVAQVGVPSIQAEPPPAPAYLEGKGEELEEETDSLTEEDDSSAEDFVLAEGELPVWIEPDGTYCYVNRQPEENERLRRAFATCAAMRLTKTPRNRLLEQSHTFPRSDARVAALLQEFSAVPQWLGARFNKHIDYEEAEEIRLDLLDTAGQVLWSGNARELFYHPEPTKAPIVLWQKLRRLMPHGQ